MGLLPESQASRINEKYADFVSLSSRMQGGVQQDCTVGRQTDPETAQVSTTTFYTHVPNGTYALSTVTPLHLACLRSDSVQASSEPSAHCGHHLRHIGSYIGRRVRAVIVRRVLRSSSLRQIPGCASGWGS